jgi:sulfate adenylyltransferase subunit 1 (EFTu-like GTPase family)
VLVGKVARLNHKIEINTFEELPADSLQFNEIGEVQLDLHSPIFCDPYQQNRSTGSFIVIDPINNDTVAAGMIVDAITDRPTEITDGTYAGSDVARE